MKIILSGGGTGGHIYPALAIASELKSRDPGVQLLYVGTEKGLESKIVVQRGLEFRSLDVSGIDRSSFLKAGKSVIKFPASFFQARRIIKDFKPDVIVGTGGYVSFPIVLAGTFFGIKTVIHEQNAIPGLANRHLAKRADYTLLTFEEAASYLTARSVKLTGLPVRKELSLVDRNAARDVLGVDKETFTLLVFGGSLGAASLNQAMLELIERYRSQKVQIIWITGQDGYEEFKEKLERIVDCSSLECKLIIMPYMYNIEQALAVADLAVCRAGASTVCELEIMGLPAILVPYPYAAENHQEKNARALVEKNAAAMVIDEFLDGDTLYRKIEEFRKDTKKLQIMSENMLKEAKPDALNDIVDIILDK